MAEIQSVADYLLQLQQQLCEVLEKEDNQTQFIKDHWQHPQKAGNGRTHVLSQGRQIEKAGVNFSHVVGQQLPAAATIKRPLLIDTPFAVVGLSAIIHPKNPYIPTAHFNLRCFIAKKEKGETIWWFGGGFDLTPYYGFVEDCQYWHQMAKLACDPFGSALYPQFKQWADTYFYLPHRQEPRGIGGIFFDDLQLENFSNTFAFARSVGDHFLSAYITLFKRRKDQSYGKRERQFQLYRRGRYVEFNLLYDRGTLFGLQWKGRTESILVSLPPTVTWSYNWQPKLGSEEARLYELFLVPQNWGINT